ncbi:MAG: ATP-binding cassette domain-containing protein [Aquamicrobium sp.]|uniref:branched-chain amino acid ABC transporter ATP-binding protein/permease n=1 Tax=Mesorhizobium sp. Pch-S TaxID=2082387 RepID=UPI0010127232|nr:ATP-binding cassette domain-containing protein [Mesorhizobium sp. Pch-S]MBR2692438.1 ATP-binding cassette domain-containing protein [Aquamicrobium sp.]QAZ46214.1 branched-chain amino acid ABC transporter ATP-binding protein [Mesorhizobium sp. Pch-S]
MKRASIRASLVIIIAAIVLGGAITGLLSSYWVFLATSVLITGVALQSLGLVAGRTGMIALCQMSFAGVGAWTVGYLNLAEAPGGLALWILLGGLAAVPLGVAIGLPALRLRGINLAIITLSFAAAFDVILATMTFPGQTAFIQVPRPALFDSDEGYFAFALIFYVVIAVALEFLARSRLGASWLAVRHSERAAAAHGVSVAKAKLSSFAISAFIAGISGGLLAGYLGTLVAENFSMMQSLSLYAVAVMTGAHFAEGAIIGGLLVVMFPEILRRFDLPQDIGNVLFALGATQALSTGETMSETYRRLLRKLAPKRRPSGGRSSEGDLPVRVEHAKGAALTVDKLTVRYGTVLALDGVDLTIPAGSVAGLIGPNGAGKSTFIDAVSGFLAAYEGSIKLGATPLEGQAAHLRARAGVRRTWQTNRIAPELTVGGYLRLAAGNLSEAEVRAMLDWLDCPNPETPVVAVDAGTRRLLDVAGVVAARPAIILLDEPAAGQSHEETLRLGKRIAEIPARFGSSVLLVEHDMDLVRAACSQVTVLDFGRVIASGPPAVVLDQGPVKRAYLGIEESVAA